MDNLEMYLTVCDLSQQIIKSDACILRFQTINYSIALNAELSV